MTSIQRDLPPQPNIPTVATSATPKIAGVSSAINTGKNAFFLAIFGVLAILVLKSGTRARR